jgi:hypothetical protein
MRLVLVIGLYVALLGFLIYCRFGQSLIPARYVPPLGIILVFMSAMRLMQGISLGSEGAVLLLLGLVGLVCAAATWRRDRLRVRVFWLYIGVEAVFTDLENITEQTPLIVISIIATAMEIVESE